LRRGFKAESKRLAIELRAEIGLTRHDPLDPWKLAELYGVDVYALSDVGCSAEALTHFTLTRPEVFSGALVPLPIGVAIIENTAHSRVRRISTMAHEMAHVTLEHVFPATLVNEKGCRTSDPGQEAEATELSGELLIPFDAALRFARQRLTNEEVADRFGVSPAVARWRLDSTGARKIARRQADAYRRKVGG
jgi:IrrE N-terminal-like domain